MLENTVYFMDSHKAKFLLVSSLYISRTNHLMSLNNHFPISLALTTLTFDFGKHILINTSSVLLILQILKLTIYKQYFC